MSRINFDNLPLNSDQARAARNYFGWPQAKAAEESGLPVHKLKRFESGNYIPDSEFLEALRAFYEKRGYVFDDTPAPGAKAKSNGQVFPGGVVGDTHQDTAGIKPYRDRAGAAKVHHMRIALQDEGEIGRVLDLIEENEEKAADLVRTPIKTGFFGLSDETQAKHAEAVRLLAENGTLFAKLFGREIAGKPTADSLKASKEKPTTTGDLLHSLQSDAHLTAGGDPDAKDRRKARKPAENVAQALGLG
jgi:transcriptional regulator with XRE-family HTH domain